MSYDDYLHRSFDYQLYATPSHVLDWAPTRALARHVLATAPYPAVVTRTTTRPWHVSKTTRATATAATSATSTSSSSSHAASSNSNSNNNDTRAGANSGSTDATSAAMTATTTPLMTACDDGIPQPLPPSLSPSATTRVDGDGSDVAVATTMSPLLQLPQLEPTTHKTVPSHAHARGESSSNSNSNNNSNNSHGNKDDGGDDVDVVAGSSSSGSSVLAQRYGEEASTARVAASSSSTTTLHVTDAVDTTASHSNSKSNASGSSSSSARASLAHAHVTARHLAHCLHAAMSRHTPRLCANELVCQSYGFATAYTTPSFALTAALYSALGHSHTWQWLLQSPQQQQQQQQRDSSKNKANAAASTTAATSAAADDDSNKTTMTAAAAAAGVVQSTRALRVSQVVQVCWWWKAMRWRGTCNVRLLPLPLNTSRASSSSSTARAGGSCSSWLPTCEYAMHTPWTDWCVQRDEQVTKAAGFLTLYKSRTLSHKDEQQQASLQTHDERQHEHQQQQQHQQQHTVLHDAATHKSNDTSTAAAPVAADVIAASSPPPLHEADEQQQLQPQSQPPQQPRASTWYRLRELRVGAGVAIKNDWYSGTNIYGGATAQLGSGLGVSAHMDVLRRVCVALTSRLGGRHGGGRVEVAARLRVNLITFHATALDVGVCCRPLCDYPHTTLRLSTSSAGTLAGVHIRDVTHELCGRWLAARGHMRHEAHGKDDTTAIVTVADEADDDKKKDSHAARHARLPRQHVVATATRSAASATERGNSASSSSSSNNSGSADVDGSWFSLDWSTVTTPVTGAWAAVAPYATLGRWSSTASPLQQQQQQQHNAQQQQHNAQQQQQLWRVAPLATSYNALQQTRQRVCNAQHAVMHTARTLCRRVRRLDWLETLLDTAHVDVSCGVLLPPDAAVGRSWRCFVTLSAH